MDMVIVDLAKTLIHEYQIDRDDVLDAIGSFRCHNVEDVLNLIEQAKSSSASSFSHTPNSAYQNLVCSFAPQYLVTSISSPSSSKSIQQEGGTDPALLPFDPASGSYTDYVIARQAALRRRTSDMTVSAVGSDMISLERTFARTTFGSVICTAEQIKTLLPTHFEAENMSRDQ
eukprot:gene41196-50994_t